LNGAGLIRISWSRRYTLASGDLMRTSRLAAFHLLLGVPLLAGAQRTTPDEALLAEIREIRAFDNHAHPLPFAPVPADAAIPADPRGRDEFPYPVRLRATNDEWAFAWQSLYGTRGVSSTAANAVRALENKRALMRTHGDAWPTWVLDRVRIETMLVNMPTTGPSLPSPRFRWVPHADALIFPFGQPGSPAGTSPASLDVQAKAIVSAVQRWHDSGVVAAKLAIAYQRPIAIRTVAASEAEAAWLRLVAAPAGAMARSDEYRVVQDYLLGVLSRELGRTGIVLHVHTGIGADAHFNIAGADPLLLEPFLNDSANRATRVVLVHGGWPFDRQAGAMLIRPNVWADFSAHTFLRSEHDLAKTLRGWLEWYPEKVLFGTDAYPEGGAPVRDWEEHLWIANETGRRALAIALTEMMQDGQITRGRARVLARMVLRDNARALYRL
jgi:uncharacterized protein